VLTQTDGSPSVQTTTKDCRGARFADNDQDNTFVKDPRANVVFSTVVTQP
jgi:hypothetical protein